METLGKGLHLDEQGTNRLTSLKGLTGEHAMLIAATSLRLRRPASLGASCNLQLLHHLVNKTLIQFQPHSDVESISLLHRSMTATILEKLHLTRLNPLKINTCPATVLPEHLSWANHFQDQDGRSHQQEAATHRG